MDFAFSKSPCWTESIRACTVSLLFTMFSFTTNRANSKQMGLGINRCSLWNIFRIPQLINTLFMKCLYQYNTLLGQNTRQYKTGQSLRPSSFQAVTASPQR